jgi:chromate transport protein ChrA
MSYLIVVVFIGIKSKKHIVNKLNWINEKEFLKGLGIVVVAIILNAVCDMAKTITTNIRAVVLNKSML